MKPSRRQLLVVAAGACASLSGCAAGGTVSAGMPADYAVDSLTSIGEGVAIGRDAEGLYAITTICTHLQCDMANQGSLTPDLLTCNCHDSTFDGAGEVLGGPANRPLDFYEMSILEDGTLSVDKGTLVDASERLAV
jgi:cytochrome b6-f complex iron-sulfur subunit